MNGHEVPAFPPPRIGAPSWSVVLDESGKASLIAGIPPTVPRAIAWGSFTDAINTTGWAVLDLHSSSSEGGHTQSYGVGFLEGALTHTRINQHWGNMWGVDFGQRKTGVAPKPIKSFVSQHLHWMWEQVQQNPSDPYWQMLGFLLSQLRGLTDGYNAARGPSEPSVPEHEIFVMSLIDADMDDLMTAIVAHGHFVNEHFHHHYHPGPHGHCSALIQVAPGNADLWVGHNTWDSYRAMLRMVKYFDMPLPGAIAQRMVFTSNPGSLYSADDFYVIDTGLTVLETSITNYNKSLLTIIKPESVLTWARTMVANRLAMTGASWTEMHSRYVSGTCNNQWMVVDNKRFTPGQPLLSDMLWILETLPGYAKRADVTKVLIEQGSWPSYNIPYFVDVQMAGGWLAMQRKHPTHSDEYNFYKSNRARMFTRTRMEGSVTSLSSFMRFLRYNNLTDPLAKGDACHGISSRCDLNPPWHRGYDCYGGVDAKVMRWRPVGTGDLSFIAVGAPTYSNGKDGLRPFSWNDVDASVDGCKVEQHVGHPTTFNFSWYVFPETWYAPWDTLLVETAGTEEMGAVGWAKYCVGFGVLAFTLGLLLNVRRKHKHIVSLNSDEDYVSIQD